MKIIENHKKHLKSSKSSPDRGFFENGTKRNVSEGKRKATERNGTGRKRNAAERSGTTTERRAERSGTQRNDDGTTRRNGAEHSGTHPELPDMKK